MNEEFTAIETAYKGYLFRSRLEARWAVYFETMGYGWQYEPEGIRLPSGNYLPDFHVVADRAGYPTWWEVKPPLPGGAIAGHRTLDPRWPELVACTQIPLTVSYGLPGPDDHGWPILRIDAGNVWTDGVVADWNRHAFAAARSARFEHGESPGGDFGKRAAGDR